MRAACTVYDCLRPRWARGWCKAHYGRWRRTGDPLGVWGNAVGDPRPPGLPGNPWAGHVACPSCGSDRWTMPLDGVWSSTRWGCLAHWVHPTGLLQFTRANGRRQR